MKRKFLVSSLAIGFGLASAAGAQTPSTEPAKGSPVTISGCVITDKDHSVVLTHVEDLTPNAASTPNPTIEGMAGMGAVAPVQPKVIYWIAHESIKLVKGNLGNKVQLTGTITDLSTGTLKIKQEPGKPGPDNDNKVEVSARGKEATGKTDKSVGPTPNVKLEQTETLPVRRIKVDTVKVLATTCP